MRAQDGVGAGYGFNCIGSEMGHLFYYELGGAGGSSILTTHNANLTLFQDVQSAEYWSGTGHAPLPDPFPEIYAWNLNFNNGRQDANPKEGLHFAMAVRDGDVVPEPASLALLGLGLAGLALSRRKR